MSERASLSFLCLAFTKAQNRFMTGGERPFHLNKQAMRHLEDPDTHPDPFRDPVTYADLYVALSNALRTARAADLRLSEALGGGEWWKLLEEPDTSGPFTMAAFPRAIPGFRYARNAVEHDGAELIDTEGEPPEYADRTIVHKLIWKDFDATRTTGKASYKAELAGKNIHLSLAALNVLLIQGMTLAAERGYPIDE